MYIAVFISAWNQSFVLLITSLLWTLVQRKFHTIVKITEKSNELKIHFSDFFSNNDRKLITTESAYKSFYKF